MPSPEAAYGVAEPIAVMARHRRARVAHDHARQRSLLGVRELDRATSGPNGDRREIAARLRWGLLTSAAEGYASRKAGKRKNAARADSCPDRPLPLSPGDMAHVGRSAVTGPRRSLRRAIKAPTGLTATRPLIATIGIDTRCVRNYWASRGIWRWLKR